MTFSKKELTTLVRGNLGDPAKLDLTEIEQHIDNAVAEYNRHRPALSAADLAGDGATFDFSLPSGFVVGFSVIDSIEYPQGKQIPEYLAETDYIFYTSTTDTKIRFLFTMKTGETSRVLYTSAQVLGDETSATTTIIAQDRVAIEYLATAFSCIQLAAEAARQYKSTTTDIPLLPGPVDDYRTLAEDYMTKWYNHMGIDEMGSVPAASLTGALPWDPSWGRIPLVRETTNPIPEA